MLQGASALDLVPRSPFVTGRSFEKPRVELIQQYFQYLIRLLFPIISKWRLLGNRKLQRQPD